MAAQREIDESGLARRIEALPGFVTVRAAAARSGVEAHLVGGAVRDALLGLEPTAAAPVNLDLVVVGDHLALVEALGGEARLHERFETATVELAEGPVDIARARTESYAHPGALPDVRPAGLAEDMARRDFTVNALAVPLAEPGAVLDLHGGRDDLRAGRLRVLHDRSFVDDPTRALRAARYAARLDFELAEPTMQLLRQADLDTVSADRVATELERLAGEAQVVRGLELLADWGLLAIGSAEIEAVDRVRGLLAEPRWSGSAELGPLLVEVISGEAIARARELAELRPGSASEAVALARGRPSADLVLARALGGEWLDAYVDQWRDVRLEISGEDLIAAGVAQGPGVGRGLEAALRAKLDGEAATRDDELRVALAAAGE